MTTTAEMEVLLGLAPLHVMIEVEGQVGINRLMLPNSGYQNPLTSFTPKYHARWGMNPSYGWGQTGCIQDLYTTRYPWSSSLTDVNGRPIKALVLGCVDGA